MSRIILIALLVLLSPLFANAQNDNGKDEGDVNEINRLNKEVGKLYANAEFDKAIKASKEELALREKVYGVDDEDVVAAHLNLAVIYRTKGDYKNSIKSFQNALRIYQKNNNTQVAEITKEIGFTYFYKGDKPQAETMLQNAVDISEKTFGSSSKETLNFLMTFANFCDLTQKDERADALFRRAIEIAKNTFEENSDEDILAFGGYEYFLKRTKGEKEAIEILKSLRRPKEKKEEDSKKVVRGGGVTNGKAFILPQPIYPQHARAAKASGTVVVQVMIDENGNVTKAIALCGHPSLMNAAVSAAKKAKFTPTLFNGNPVKVTGTINYNFIPPR